MTVCNEELNVVINTIHLNDLALQDAKSLLDCDNPIILNDKPDLMIDIINKSKSDIRRNGWNKYIPNGYSEFKIGRNNRIYIFKPMELV